MNCKFKPLLLAILLVQQHGLMAQEDSEQAPKSVSASIAASAAADVAASIEASNAAQQAAPAGVEEIAIFGKFIPQEKRSTASISNVLSAEAFVTAGDTNVADGLKRISGLNLQNGKFIYIRGLGERYSSTILNGSTLPSPEPINRVVPLDLFPSSIIESVLVQKTFSAKFPAEFAGGTIVMRTKIAPDEAFFKLSGSVGYSGLTTGKDGLTYKGGGKDWLGYDDGTRDMPQALSDAVAGDRELRINNRLYTKGFSAAELETIGESLSNNYALQTETIKPDRSLGANFGKSWSFADDDLRVGILGNLSYSNSWDTLKVSRNTYSANGKGELTPYNLQQWNATQDSVDTSAFFTTGIDYQGDHKVKATVLEIHKMDDLAGQLTGFLGSQDETIRQNRLEFIEQDLLTKQIDGEHYFDAFHELTINWHYNKSRAQRDAPDMRQYRYFLDTNADKYRFELRLEANTRMWSALEDRNTDKGISFDMGFNTPFDTFTQVSFGVNQMDKERESDIRRFAFLQQGNVNKIQDLLYDPVLDNILTPATIAPDGFQILEVTRPTDNYSANQSLDAWFTEADFKLGESYRLLVGFRGENSKQKVKTFDLFAQDNAPVISELASNDIFPALTGTWILDQWDMQLRASYSKTISRPDFRELSPAPFTHPVTGYNIIGNPNLTVAYIKNYDLRWEWYFSADESASIGLFYKQFDAPIEAVIQPGSEGNRTFINAKEAYTQGIEFDAYHWLGFINEHLESFFTAVNVTLIQSEVNIRPEDAGILTNSTRPLQGQADYLFNLQIGYDDRDIQKGSFVYNVTGPKIREVGVLLAPDVIDNKYGQLDFAYTRTLTDKLEMNVKIKNLLNQQQRTTQGGKDVNSFYDGTSGSVGLNYTF